ncbi:MAG: hypothetical protein ACE37K_17540 [Planctomycetota bacterium]
MNPTWSWRRVVGLVLALAWLHTLAVLPLHDPALWATAATALPPDLLLLLAVAVIGGAAGWPKRIAHVAAFGMLVSTFSRVCEVVSVLAFQKAFELADLPRLHGLFDAWANKAPTWERWAWGGALVALVVVLLWVTSRAFRAVARTAMRPRVAGCWLFVLQALVLLGLLCPQRPFEPSPLRLLAGRSWDALRLWIDRDAVLAPLRLEIAAGERRMRETPHDLQRLDGADVYLLVLESYGRVALRHPQTGPDVRALLAGFEADLRRRGLASCSSAIAPAVKGGGSGLAHAELLTGVRVPTERVRAMLMQSGLVALPKRFREAGYGTFELLPGMPIHWPEGDAFYGVDRSIIQSELGYDGTRYDFGQMPDQFALQRLLERVVVPAERPVFAMFVGVSSHAPWSAIPPFVDDWQIDERTFLGGPATTHDVQYLSMFRDPDVLPAYVDSLGYVLRTSFGFAARLERPSIVVVLGDHQPPIAASVSPPDRSFDVPVHLVSNRPELLDPWRAQGFTDGLDVPDATVAWPMAEFAVRLLRAYSR